MGGSGSWNESSTSSTIRFGLSSLEFPSTAISLMTPAEFSIALTLSLFDEELRIYCCITSASVALPYYFSSCKFIISNA